MSEGVSTQAVARRLRHLSLAAETDPYLGLEVDGLPMQQVEATALIASCLGADHYLVEKLDALRDRRPGRHGARLGEFLGYIDAAVSLMAIERTPVDVAPICDPDLWADVRGLVEASLWDKIPARVTTFVEHWFRERAGNPPTKTGDRSYGDAMMRSILGSASPLALGSQANESKGWADLGSGMMQAIGNANRHAIHDRADAERFAWGVIGLGSLLIGEVKRTHPLTGDDGESQADGGATSLGYGE